MDTVFEDIKTLTKMVSDGYRNSLVVSGDAGTGKSHTVINALKNDGLDEGVDFTVIKGRSTTFALYESLLNNADGLLVYDDCDSVLKNADALNILKGALDSSAKRWISWKSRSTYDWSHCSSAKEREYEAKGKLPDKFLFKGRIIFITNIHKDNLNDALKSRSFVVNVKVNNSDIVNKIESVIDNIKVENAEVPLNIKKEVLGYFKELLSNDDFDRDFNMRTYLAGLSIRMSSNDNWKRLIKLYA